MSSTLVGYSSGEDEYGNEKKGGQRQSDANYQTMDMDMSDEEDSNTKQQHVENPANSEMFSSSADFNAYNQQFENRQNSNSSLSKTNRTDHNAGAKLDSTSSVRRDGKRNDSSSENESSSDRHRDSYSDRSQSYNKRDRLPDSSHQTGSRKHHHRSSRDDRDHYRRRSRSRSGDRGSSSSYSRSRRRSRSRDRGGAGPSNNRPYRKSSRSRERDRNRKLHSMGLTAGPDNATAAAVQVQSYESQLEKVKEITGVEVPKYYNPSAINPLKYAEQIKKRQMLWSKPKPASTEQREPGCVAYVASAGSIVPQNPSQAAHTEKPVVEMRSSQLFSEKPNTNSSPMKGSYNKWESTNFGNDKANEKFRRLMGIKDAGSEAATGDQGDNSSSQAPSAKWFADQEQQYEKARATTHTQRGLGLGFAGMVSAATAPSSSAAAASNTTSASSMHHPVAKPPQKMPGRPE